MDSQNGEAGLAWAGARLASFGQLLGETHRKLAPGLDCATGMSTILLHGKVSATSCTQMLHAQARRRPTYSSRA
jgi:hypothetical protein